MISWETVGQQQTNLMDFVLLHYLAYFVGGGGNFMLYIILLFLTAQGPAFKKLNVIFLHGWINEGA